MLGQKVLWENREKNKKIDPVSRSDSSSPALYFPKTLCQLSLDCYFNSLGFETCTELEPGQVVPALGTFATTYHGESTFCLTIVNFVCF